MRSARPDYRPSHMSGVNQITIVGNVGSAPELSYGQNNVPFCRFSVAVNEQWKTNGEKRSRVTWFPVTVFNSLAESCANYIERGRLLAVQGRVQTREYKDREGTKHQVMQVAAERITFLGAGKREEQDDRRPSPGQPQGDAPEQNASDVLKAWAGRLRVARSTRSQAHDTNRSTPIRAIYAASAVTHASRCTGHHPPAGG